MLKLIDINLSADGGQVAAGPATSTRWRGRFVRQRLADEILSSLTKYLVRISGPGQIKYLLRKTWAMESEFPLATMWAAETGRWIPGPGAPCNAEADRYGNWVSADRQPGTG